MKIKISSSFSGVISRGSYENSRPGFQVDVEGDLSSMKLPEETVDETIDRWQKQLQKTCYENFKACEEQAIVERIQKERADIRIKVIDGKPYPSVTSIIGFDADMYCSPEELAQYAAQSNLCHAQVADYIETGVWKEAKDVPGTWTDIVIVTKGSLKLECNGWSFPNFLEKHPIRAMANAPRSINEEHVYCGGPDFTGIPKFDGAQEVFTVFDVKRTADKVKNFKQMAAYAKMKGYENVKQMVIVPLNNKTQQGFSKPIVETRIDQYFEMFLKDREAFKKRFGI